MSRLADGKDFPDAMVAAAAKLRVATGVIEKDYWVTQALRALAVSHPADWIFKGGTSLSKGYGLIQRFSEDIDVLVLPAGRGSGARDRVMKEMARAAAAALEASELPPSVSADKGVHRSYALEYPLSAPRSAHLRPSVLLEMGIRGGDAPKESREIGTLIGSAGILEPEDYDDLAPFTVLVLHPGRTLAEKLLLVHDIAAKVEAGELQQLPTAFGRHLYDIHQLLGSDQANEFLGDRADYLRVCDEAFAIGSQHFGARAPRPDDGFSVSPAFARPEDDGLCIAMDKALNAAEGLAFAGAAWPTYAQLRSRVQGMADRL